MKAQRGREEKGEKEVENIHLDGQHVTEFLTMFACMTMCTCIVLTVNLQTEYEKIDQFMLGREDKQVKKILSC